MKGGAQIACPKPSHTPLLSPGNSREHGVYRFNTLNESLSYFSNVFDVNVVFRVVVTRLTCVATHLLVCILIIVTGSAWARDI